MDVVYHKSHKVHSLCVMLFHTRPVLVAGPGDSLGSISPDNASSTSTVQRSKSVAAYLSYTTLTVKDLCRLAAA